MFAKLTKQPDGSFALPVDIAHLPRASVDDAGVQHPHTIFTLWSQNELAAIGYFHYTETTIPDGKISIGSSHSFDGISVTKTHTLADDPDYLDKQKTIMLSQIKSKRDRVRDAGIDYLTYTVETDANSRRELTGAVVSINEAGLTDMAWRMKDNTVAILLAADFKAMAIAVSIHVQSCYVNQGTLEAAVNAAINITALNAIDVSVGWPAHHIPSGAV